MKTSQELFHKIRTVTGAQPSPRDALEQRVSFVFGSMAKDSGVTREQVRKVILAQSGAEDAA